MKELHNHIFSNTTCVSKELMIKYINKQLTKSELHEVETHMLDCDLCTDAMAGMKYAKNSAVLFAIDQKINQKIESKKSNSFYKSGWLMAAASLIAVIFGAYFLMNLFDETKLNKNEMAIHENKDNTPFATKNTIEEEVVEEDVAEKNVIKNTAILDEKIVSQPSTTRAIEVKEDKETALENSLKKSQEQEDNSTESNYFSNSATNEAVLKEEPEVLLDEEAVPSQTLSDNFEATINTSIKSKGVDKTNEQNKREKSSKAPSAVSESAAGTLSKPNASKFNSASSTYYLHGVKVVDYTITYQNEEDFKKQADANGTSADFVNQEQKMKAENDLENTIVKETYKDVLERGILNFNQLDYKEALTDFELILAKHPLDVNALFYGGISAFNLTYYKNALAKFDAVLNNPYQTFNQEAKWHKALTLIALKEKSKAKKLLNEIVYENGFYKQKAIDKLRELGE